MGWYGMRVCYRGGVCPGGFCLGSVYPHMDIQRPVKHDLPATSFAGGNQVNTWLH